jgi:hypothetical protein
LSWSGPEALDHSADRCDFSGDFDADFASAANFTPAYRGILSVSSIGGFGANVFVDHYAAVSTVTASFPAAIEALTSVVIPLVGRDWSSAFSAAFGPDVDGSAPIEALVVARGGGGAAELGLTAGANPKIAWEAVSSVPANANSVVRVEGVALLFLDPSLRTEQRSATAALLLPAPAESRALCSIQVIFPAESLSGAAINALKADALLSIEGMGAARRDAPVAVESCDTYVVGVTLTLSDGRILTFATTATQTAAT